MSNVSRKNLEAMESLQDMPTYTAGIAQSAAYRLLKKFTDDCIAGYDLSMMQWYMIGTIYEAGSDGVTMGQLAKLLDTGLPYITNSINVLEGRGIVERVGNKDDSRVKHVVLQKKYVPVVQKIENDLRVKMRGVLYQNISPEELLIYIKVLYKLTAVLDD